MKLRHSLAVGALVAAAAVALAVSKRAPAASPRAVNQRARPAPIMVTQPVMNDVVAQPATQAKRIEADQIVARVNGVAIEGRRLAAFGSDREQTMSPEMFDFLRKRAIDRELIFQEARREHIVLTAPQLAELEQVRRNSIERGVTDPGQLDLEVEEARANVLQTVLLVGTGASLAITDADIDQYLEAHPDETDRLEARQKLTDDAQATYGARVREYLDGLAAAAQVD